MKPQISKKVLVQLSLGSTIVVLAVILLYLGFSGHPAPARPGVSSQVAGRTAPRAVVPPAAPAAPTGRQVPGSPGAPPSLGTQVAQTPAGSKPPAGAPPPTAGVGQPAPATKPGKAPSAAPGSPLGSEPAAPAPAAVPAKPRDREAAVVGTGQHGRSDPFAPLVTPESQRAAPGPALPPPPGVGLPMPPGFAAPGGGPGAAPPPSPGAGMKVTGIMGSRNRVAIIEVDGQTHIVGVGERIGDAVVVSILPEKVVMKQHNVTFELGIGGDRSS
jgi:hypothetical protein